MFCENCGNKINDTDKFCEICGAALTASATVCDAQTEVLTPAAEVEAEVSPVIPEPAKKKNFKGLIIAAAVTVAVVLAGLLVAFNFKAIAGGFVKTFGSESAYMRYVEVNAFKGYANTASSIYGNVFLENMTGDVAAEGDITFEAGEGLLDLLDDNDIDSDSDWIDNAKLGIKVNQKGEDYAVELNLLIKKQEIASAVIMVDGESGEVYMGLPGLAEEYVKGEYDTESSEMVYNQILDMDEVFPDKGTVKELAVKYAEIALNQIDDVKESDGELTADGITQKCTVLELKIDELLIANISKAVIEELREDKAVKNIIGNVQAYMDDNDVFGDSEIDIYEEFLESLDDALESVEDKLDELDGDEGETYIKIKDYVNSKSEIIGRKIKYDGEEVLSYAKTKNGTKIGFELEMSGIVIEGSGTERNGKISGTFDVAAMGLDVCELTLKNFNVDKAKEGYLNGVFTINLDKDILSSSSEMAMLGSIADTIEIDAENSKNKSKVSIALLDGDDIFARVTLDCKKAKPTEVEFPKNSDTVDGTDGEEMEAWLSEIDFDELVDRLEDAGVPDEIIEAIEGVFGK